MPAVLVNWSLLQFQALVLILMRVSPILFMMPVFSSRSLPNLLKAGLTLTVSLILLPLVQLDPRLLPSEPIQFGFLMAAELMIGLILGLSVKIIFTGIQMSGELAGFQMGLSLASVMDPQSEVNAPILSQFLYLVSLVVFLAVDGHHWFFRALYQSFLLLAPGEIHLQEGLYRHFLGLLTSLFVVAIKIAAPVMAVLIFTQIGLGILAKAVPQINILITSFPLTLGIGLLFLALSIELILPTLKDLFQQTGRELVFTLLPLMQR
ncbi:MAG: flagellar biosynthetic protein FliR [Deltaproteobacteria bacterium]|jgi:flagellar biosynthetic protein FliR|nr:flagellar biosynthetic protein FliR [Deltaproteobacteria bacterium]